MLTIQVLTKNNKNTIEDCINSILPLNGDIIICDLGSSDDTIKICKKMNISCTHQGFRDDFSNIRNNLLKEGWNFLIKPWEVLQYGHQEINDFIEKNEKAYQYSIIQSGAIVKETRLWHSKLNLKFINPVYETLSNHTPEQSHGIIFSEDETNEFDKLDLIKKWIQKSPNQSQPYYYYAMSLLSNGKTKEFLTASEHYLHKEEEPSISSTMLQYYCASVLCHEKNSYSATQHILNCLANNTLMAEFWCLLGDIHYKLLKDYVKAKKFYQNAIFLGGKRLKEDDWPMDIDKYNKYPTKMIQRCVELINNKTILVSK